MSFKSFLTQAAIKSLRDFLRAAAMKNKYTEWNITAVVKQAETVFFIKQI